MVRLRRACLVTAVVGAATMAVRTPAAQQARLVDATIPVGYAIPLSTPATPFRSVTTIAMILRAAQVPFGIEEAAPTDAPAVDFATPRVELDNLHGRSVGEALAAVVRVDPTVHWVEKDGVIDVRFTAAPTWIDREILPFSVTNGSASEALAALVGAIDPGRQDRVAPFAPFQGLPIAVRTTPPAPSARLSVNQTRGTVLDGLNALARSTQGSWRISYDGPALEANDASIQFSPERDSPVESASPMIESERADPNLIRVRIDTGIDGPIGAFAAAAHVPVSVESLPHDLSSRASEGIVLMLDRRQPRLALDRLLAYDSRYVLTEVHDEFRVEPRTGSVLPALAMPLASFVANNEAFNMALNRLLGRGGLGIRTMPDADRWLVTPVSITAADSTVRDVLDALCRAIGATWSAEPSVSGVTMLTIRSQSRAMSTTTSWRPTTGVSVTPRLLRLPIVPVTLRSLEWTLPRAMAAVPTPFGAYLREISQTPGEQDAALAAEAKAPAWNSTGLNSEELLAKLIANVPGLEWKIDNGVYHLQPIAPDPDAIMNRHIPPIDVRAQDLRAAATHVLRAIVGHELVSSFTGGPFLAGPIAPPVDAGPIHIVFAGGTVREALDAVTRTHNAPSWILNDLDTGRGHSVTLTLCSPDGTDCQVASTSDR